VLGVVVVTGGKGVETASQAIDGRVEIEVVIIGKDDVEVSVEQGGGELVKVPGDEGQTDEIALGAMSEDAALGLERQVKELDLCAAVDGLFPSHDQDGDQDRDQAECCTVPGGGGVVAKSIVEGSDAELSRAVGGWLLIYCCGWLLKWEAKSKPIRS
jgi:hypothetical protein